VPDDAISAKGRRIQCGDCGHAWVQRRPAETVVAAAVGGAAEPTPSEATYPEVQEPPRPDPIPDPAPEPALAENFAAEPPPAPSVAPPEPTIAARPRPVLPPEPDPEDPFQPEGEAEKVRAEIARALHEAGATVGLSGTREEPLNSLAADLGDRAHVLPCNLSDAEAVNALPKQAVEAMGAVDILVNNAGVTRDNLFMRMSEEEWATVIEVNLTAAFRLSKGVLRGMMKARWGRIVNVSSVVGTTGNPGQGNYAASKAGLVGMSKSLAYEVASRGITVNAIAPGFIATAMTDKLTDDQKAKIDQQIPAGRMGSPTEIAAAALYLSSNEAAYTTGTVLHVNGGLAMI
jgi:3-oxoacyl-[acyl-carrier protein] reductase